MNSLSNNRGKIEGKKSTKAHLLTQIVKKQVNSQQPLRQQQQKQCLYGVLCAHLRAQGKCKYPHQRTHFHFLNLVPPVDCINDDEEGKQLSKVNKKQQKIIEKTINQHIDVGKLNRIEHQIKKGGEQLIKKEIWQQIDQKEKTILEIVNSFDVSEIFIKLNEAKGEGLPIFEVKRKATVQLKKKNEKLYIEMIDKEYRIANRLIKAFAKNKSLSLYDLYVDINHDTIKSVRAYFESYFKDSEGIPRENQVSQTQSKVCIKTLYQKLLFVKPQQYQHKFYIVKIADSGLINQLKGQVQFFNMLVPFSIQKLQSFNKFYLVDSSQLTFTAFSNILTKEYLATFHAKFKAAPEYLFGQIQQNETKFQNWASKIHSKYTQNQSVFKSVFILYNTRSVFKASGLQQFQMQKLRQKITVLKNLLSLFNSVLIYLTQDGVKITKKKLIQVLYVNSEQIGSGLSFE